MTASRAMRSLSPAFILALLLLSSPPAQPKLPLAASLDTFAQTATGSWALGMVVPQGASLSTGQKVSWGSVTNLTALVRIPDLGYADNTVLAVLSAMVSDSSVVQVSAGLFPGSDTWRAVGWLIPDVGAVHHQYIWVLNSTYPPIAPGSLVSLSLFSSAKGWSYSLTDLDTGLGVAGTFAGGSPQPLKSGDQEVFALESYSSNVSLFSSMGNLTLQSLFVDGKVVTGGTYYLGDWDPTHQPLFVVGGLPPPSWIAVTSSPNGTVVWGYSNEWGAFGITPLQAFYPLLLLSAVVVPVLLFYLLMRFRPAGARGDDGPSQRIRV